MKRWFAFILGIVILTFGARTLLFSGIGVGGLDAIAVGLAKILNLEIGTMLVMMSIVLIGIGNLISKKFVISPIITALIIGKCYDLWGSLIFNRLIIPQNEGILGSIYLIGLLIAPIGAALYIFSNISLGPVDYLMRSIEKRYSFSMQKSRIVIEGIFVITGYLVGGPIGIGTIGIMLFWGPILQTYYECLIRYIKL